MAGDFFKIRERGSTARTEVLGGITTFTTMAYIIVVNPAILSFAGFPTGRSTRGGDGGRSLRRLDWR